MNAAPTASLALLLALASSRADAAATTRPLQLDLVAPAPRSLPAEAPRRPALANANATRNPLLAPAFRRPTREAARQARAQDFGERALENVLDPSTPRVLEEERGEGQLQLKFNKRGNAFRDLGRSYRDMLDRVSTKVWDEPNGKRVRFDVAGKPGIGIEIPVGHRGAKR